MLRFSLLLLVIVCGVQAKPLNLDENIIQGDIFLTDQQKLIRSLPENAFMRIFTKDTGNNRWPSNTIPYTMSNKYSKEEKEKIRSALKEFQEATCFKFPERTNQKDYVYIQPPPPGYWCGAYMGKTGGRQFIYLDHSEYCLSNFVVKHEMMHTLGFEHEHVRPDRDNYIDVLVENIDPALAKKNVFDKVSTKSFDTAGLPYDLKSIMHYHGNSYAKTDPKTGQQKATMKIKGTNKVVPLHPTFSETDFKRIAILGKCSPKGNNQKGKQKSSGKKVQNKRS